ncbi:MAG: UDP-N-acetylmuramoyl-L-alanine--D-glutamate ligase [Candidatus Azambacteria bacterium]|nr:UDP-N-acetylmuramoyl-L-alanine--D-glutamate ligase [Candidatus Azambacteria bacterium]
MIRDFKNKKVVIMGLGSYAQGSGLAAALFFAKAGAKVLVTDSKPVSLFTSAIVKLKKYPTVRFVFGKHREQDFATADLIIKNPDVPKSSPFLRVAKENGVPVWGDWTVFLAVSDAMIIGVTGSKGKSTTATLIHNMVQTIYRAHLCGNIGVSPLALGEKIKDDDVVVAELSSWGLYGFEAAHISPHMAVITNLFPEHLNKYKNIGEYYKDKEIIFRYQRGDDWCIANRDNTETKKRVMKAKSTVLWFSKKPFRGDGAYVQKGAIVFAHGGKKIRICAMSDIHIPGTHNCENVLAAVCVAMCMGVPPKTIKKAISDFRGVPGRMEVVRTVKGVTYYNDTTATMPDATIAALDVLSGKHVILLAGGADKKLDYRELARAIKRHAPKLVLFSGAATEKLIQELKKIKYTKELSVVTSMKEAVHIAHSEAKKGGVVLLSPGAASFGIFKNEFDRGDQFSAHVRKLS